MIVTVLLLHNRLRWLIERLLLIVAVRLNILCGQTHRCCCLFISGRRRIVRIQAVVPFGGLLLHWHRIVLRYGRRLLELRLHSRCRRIVAVLQIQFTELLIDFGKLLIDVGQ